MTDDRRAIPGSQRDDESDRREAHPFSGVHRGPTGRNRRFERASRKRGRMPTGKYGVVTIAFALLLTACASEDVDPEALPDVGEATEDARAEAEEALANLRTEAQETVEEVRTNAAPEIKQELLDRCREALERLREAESDVAGSVEDICMRIEGSDVSNADVWSDIEREIDNVRIS